MARKISVKVDRQLCAGCGACESRVSHVFMIKEGKSTVSYAIQDETDGLVKAADNCPRKAIKIRVISRW